MIDEAEQKWHAEALKADENSCDKLVGQLKARLFLGSEWKKNELEAKQGNLQIFMKDTDQREFL